MTVNKHILRGILDIRTLSGKVDQKDAVYKAYMKLSCLEMEKYRRGKERESAMRRVENIDGRFREIDTEKDALLRMLKTHQGAGPEQIGNREPAPIKSDGRIKLRY